MQNNVLALESIVDSALAFGFLLMELGLNTDCNIANIFVQIVDLAAVLFLILDFHNRHFSHIF